MTQLLDENQAAKFLGVRPGTLAHWRSTRRYPLAFVKVGSIVRYDVAALERFIQARTITPGKKPRRRRKRSS